MSQGASARRKSAEEGSQSYRRLVSCQLWEEVLRTYSPKYIYGIQVLQYPGLISIILDLEKEAKKTSGTSLQSLTFLTASSYVESPYVSFANLNRNHTLTGTADLSRKEVKEEESPKPYF